MYKRWSLQALKKVAIVQSNYIPWKGYFDLIAAVDEFILFDDMQYTRRDWRNRNKIKTPNGIQWLTVPVVVKGKYDQKIHETEIDGSSWSAVHWKSLELNFGRCEHFDEVAHWLKPLYLGEDYTHLSFLNQKFITAICDYLGILTQITNSSDYSLVEGKTERLADLCIQAGAQEYIAGPASKDYIEEKIFQDSGVTLSWFNYDGYPEYPQLWGDFNHGVSILDLLFNCGKDSSRFMKWVA